MNRMSGASRLFRVAGIDIFVHWSWLLVAFFEIRYRSQAESNVYTSPIWNVLEFGALFAIVLMHEFGHVLACRSVGGRADTILLWPLGGVAYMQPPLPPRPGAVLWIIAAGPLVNLLLVPATVAAWVLLRGRLSRDGLPTDLSNLCWAVMWINGGLLFFNLLPIYPLDGGQILRSLLWFVIGPVRSLQAVSVIGVFGGLGLIVLAYATSSWILGLIAAYAIYRWFVGFRQARLATRILATPRHLDAACPACGEVPFRASFWLCSDCRTSFDPFEHGACCPKCGRVDELTMCLLCHQQNPIADWYGPAKGGEHLPEALPPDTDVSDQREW